MTDNKELETPCGRTVYGIEDLMSHEDSCANCLEIASHPRPPLPTECLKCGAVASLTTREFVAWMDTHPKKCDRRIA